MYAVQIAYEARECRNRIPGTMMLPASIFDYLVNGPLCFQQQKGTGEVLQDQVKAYFEQSGLKLPNKGGKCMEMSPYPGTPGTPRSISVQAQINTS